MNNLFPQSGIFDTYPCCIASEPNAQCSVRVWVVILDAQDVIFQWAIFHK